jgi:hypothetical protein
MNVSDEPAASVFRVEDISLKTMLLIIPKYKCGPEESFLRCILFISQELYGDE